MWNDELDARALKLQADGYSASQIAEIVFGDAGKRNSVIGRLSRLAHGARSRARSITAPAPMPAVMPAPKHGRSGPASPRRARKFGGWSRDAVQRLGAMIDGGTTQANIADEFGVSEKTISKRLAIERAKGNPDIPPATRGANGVRIEPTNKETAAERKARNDAERAACFANMFDPGHGTPLVELGSHQCRFGTGWDAENHRHLFCGDPTDFNQVYCPHHRARCYQPVTISGGRIKARDGRLTEFARVAQ